MIPNHPWTESLSVDKETQLSFMINDLMVDVFATLTGDQSSLHTDENFGRRSLYRANVVHGMLPLIFVPVLPINLLGEQPWKIKFISARFLKPLYPGQSCLLKGNIVQVDQKKSEAEMEFSVEVKENGMLLTTGKLIFTISSTPMTMIKNSNLSSDQHNKSLLTNSLNEENRSFESIGNQEEKRFNFRPEQSHLKQLLELIQTGIGQDNLGPFNLLQEPCLEVLFVNLFSTFVGMCIPGQPATFINFQAHFTNEIQLNRPYVFKGQVKHKSEATQSLIEDIEIREDSTNQTLIVKGEINTRVNKLRQKSLSARALKEEIGDWRFRNKVVLITGASRGIGETTAKLFGALGSSVIVNYVQSQKEAEDIVKEIQEAGSEAIAIKADVTDKEQVLRMVDEIDANFKRVDILVNNAVGDFNNVPFLEMDWKEIEKDLNIIVKGAFHCCQAVIPLMIKQGGGKIINVSTLATEIPPSGHVKYVIAKSGLVGLTRSLAIELAKYQIQVNMVVPSTVETDLTQGISPITMNDIKSRTPLKRHATPLDVAKAIASLASSMYDFTTGQKFFITGGNPPFN